MGITSLMLQQQQSQTVTRYNEKVDLKKDAEESLGLIMASSSLLLNLINNLLDVKKATANMMDEFVLTSVHASDTIQDAIDFCNPLASISNVSIVMDHRLTTSSDFVIANSLRLQQVLINLISNAIKYTARGSTIQISARSTTAHKAEAIMKKKGISYSNTKNNESVSSSSSHTSSSASPVLLFSVSDYGPGIDLRQASHLFSRFTRLDNQGRTLGSNKVGQPSGTGLGLNLCQMFVQRMNGCIWASNNEGRKGSTFSFYLPLVPEEVVQESLKQLPTEQMIHNDSPTEPSTNITDSFDCVDFTLYKVLVVDDTLINRKVFDRMLKQIGIINVVTVESGEDALLEISANQYDLIITDLQMPGGMSGTELSQNISHQEQSFNLDVTPVVIGLTADTSPDVAEKCAASGMSDVLYKPITVAEIQEYFKSRIAYLEPGVWYTDVRNKRRRLSCNFLQ